MVVFPTIVAAESFNKMATIVENTVYMVVFLTMIAAERFDKMTRVLTMAFLHEQIQS